ncbi:hypothetical protein C2I36_05570 [Rhodobacteraceae bacterium WD3A24]|nr:hypothetical protein C2I36_05570 [Rhodobacteraceae bacterium WD3A24]
MAKDPQHPASLIEWLGYRPDPDWSRARPLGRFIGVGLGAVAALLSLGALVAAGVVLWRTVAPSGTMGLGTGALIVALLGAPFLIWRTVIAHQTLGYQKEGHITDRINKAVEQLGAEKTISYVARNVTHPARPPEETEGDRQHEFVDRLQRINAQTESVDRIHDPEFEYDKWQVFSETVPNIEVRIGAILSLERIAQDSTTHDQGRDHVRVMEILCAYIRNNAPADDAKDHPYGEWEPLKDDATEEERAKHIARRKTRLGGQKVREWARTLDPPRADIAMALDVLGRRTPQQRRVEAAWPDPPDTATEWPFDIPCPELPDDPGEAPLGPAILNAYRKELQTWMNRLGTYRGYRLDLRETNLQGADLSGGCFSGARFNGARMDGAKLRRTRLESAILHRAFLNGAELFAARMAGANLGETQMEGTELDWAKMQGIRLEDAQMCGGSILNAGMEQAVIFRALMEGVHLQFARLVGAQLKGAHLETARLGEADMQGANLTGTRMDDADLGGARLESARLQQARMDGANLALTRMDEHTFLGSATLDCAAARDVDWSSVEIFPDQINSMFGDASVILPADIPRPRHWPEWELPVFAPKGGRTFTDEWRKWRDDRDNYPMPPPPDGE